MKCLRLYKIDVFDNIFSKTLRGYCKALFCYVFYLFFLTNSSFSQTTVSLTATADAGIWNNNSTDEQKNTEVATYYI